MKVRNLLVSTGLVVSSVIAMSTSAKAATFKTNITSNSNPPKGNVLLDSITQNGKTVKDFSLVNSAKIIYNTPVIPHDDSSGAASSDRGINATGIVANDPTNANIVSSLGNLNLNNIIDTEDPGTFDINVFFDSTIQADTSGLDSLYFWERGKNSDLQIQALDASGKTIGKSLTLLRKDQASAGYQIYTTEVGGPQDVGSWGVNLAQLGVTQLSGLKLTANPSMSGPDFKVIARKTTPEPGAMMGLGAVATLAFLRRRQRNNATCQSAN